MSRRPAPEDNAPLSREAAIDDALRTYPLRPAPARLAPAVLARLQALPAPPRFRLAWLDYALALLATVMAVVGLMFWQLVTPEALTRAQEKLIVLVQQSGLATPRPELPLAAAAVGLAGALLLLGVGIWRSGERG